jgi:hypothetical protein
MEEQVAAMQTDQITFEGTETEQRIAREVWLAMRMLGVSYGLHAPIRQPLPALVAFFARQPALAGVDDPAAAIEAALTKNSAVFARQVTDDGVVVFATTKAGRAPAPEVEDQQYRLKARLTEPEPVAAPPPSPPVEPAQRVAAVWLRPPVEPAQPEKVVPAAPAAEAVEVAPAPVEAAAVAVEPPPVEPPAAEEAAPVAVPEEPVEVDAAAVAAALRERLAADLRLISFGDEWFPDDQLMRLSRGDTKRIRDYLLERGEPLSDEELLGDVFGRRMTDRDYALVRFGLNARMSREKRDFEFVGTPQSRLWSTTGLPAIGTPKRKPAEIGQDYRFLLEEAPAVAAEPAGNALTHSLTFYEYEYGVLPLDAQLAAFFPGPTIEEQRAAVLRFDVPQLYTGYLVELRYPTANRGGFISGLEQFYIENLVPGARITIERTDNDGRYLLKFGQTDAQERRLLHLDERRGRFVFRPVTFYCEVDEDLLLSDQKFPGLNNAKPLEERERRRPELVVRVTFERVGEQVGERGAPRYYALFDDLFAAANIERPFTRSYLLAVLESEAHPEFERDPDGNAFYYDPSKVQ